MGPKAIAKKIKSKGLQKLRWYCQMCEKQCRDENGFKCHCESLSHQRNLEAFAENPDRFIEKFSKNFQAGFVDILRNRFGTSQVKANNVYQEYIKDKEHVHMNATKWVTLGDFVKNLGREGVAKVREKEGMWYVSYVDREVAERSRRAREMERQRLEEEERADRVLQRRMEVMAAKERGDGAEQEHLIEYKGHPGQDILEIKLNDREQSASKREQTTENIDAIFGDSDLGRSEQNGRDTCKRPLESSVSTAKKRARWTTKDDEDGASNDKDPSLRKDHWLVRNLIVKVVNKNVGNGAFYKKKGLITSVEEKYSALVKMRDSKAVLRLDQDDLETVIPKPGKRVKIVNGRCRGEEGELLSIDIENFVVKVQLDSGRIVNKIEYEDVCRHEQS